MMVQKKIVTLLCLPKERRRKVLYEFHDYVMAGHLGIQRTLSRIQHRYYWPKMVNQIVNYVKSCEKCQSKKSPKRSPAGHLCKIMVSQPFAKVGIDMLGPFPKTYKGNRNIIVTVDYLTKWTEVRAIPTGKATEVAKFMIEQIFLRHGAPKQLISDRGTTFISSAAEAVNKAIGTVHKTTSAFHPQANSTVERLNHTLATMLAMYVDDDHRDWDIILPYIGFAYNTSRQESMGFSPFYLLYGREAQVPSDLEYHAQLDKWIERSPDRSYDHATFLKQELEAARRLVESRMERVKMRQEKAYNAKHRQVNYEVGELVLVYKPLRKVGKADKLLHQRIGPFTILQRTTPVNYEVIRADGNVKPDVVHMVRIKPYHLRDEENEETAPAENEAEERTTTSIAKAEKIKRPRGRPKKTVAPDKEEDIGTTERTTRKNSNQAVSDNRPRTRQQTRMYTVAMIAATILLFSVVTTMVQATDNDEMLQRGGTVFMKKSSKTFSESSWTIITDIEMEPAMQFIGQINDLLTKTQVTMEMANTQPPEDRYFTQIFEKQIEIKNAKQVKI